MIGRFLSHYLIRVVDFLIFSVALSIFRFCLNRILALPRKKILFLVMFVITVSLGFILFRVIGAVIALVTVVVISGFILIFSLKRNKIDRGNKL